MTDVHHDDDIHHAATTLQLIDQPLIVTSLPSLVPTVARSFRRSPSLPSSFPFLLSDGQLVYHTFTIIQPQSQPTLLQSFTFSLFSTRTCLAPIHGLWTWITSTNTQEQQQQQQQQQQPQRQEQNTQHKISSPITINCQDHNDVSSHVDEILYLSDKWSACPNILLAWSFSYLCLPDLLRCRSVSHTWYLLHTSHPLAAVCYTSASLTIPATSRWSTRGLQRLFWSLPYLSALAYHSLNEDIANVLDIDQQENISKTVAAQDNGLRPVSLIMPAAPPNPRLSHLYTVFSLHHLRVLLLPELSIDLTDAELFAISGHLSVLEILSIILHASSSTLSAVGFAHLSSMNHLSHLTIEYIESSHVRQVTTNPLTPSSSSSSSSSSKSLKVQSVPTLNRSVDDSDVSTSTNTVIDVQEDIRMDMITKQECWLALMRCRTLRVLNILRKGRAAEEVNVWQQRRREKEERRQQQPQQKVTKTLKDYTEEGHNGNNHINNSSPSQRRASLPIVSSLHSISLHTQSLLSLPSSSSFSFSLFFSSFSSTLLSFTLISHPSHVSDVRLYTDIEQAVLAALPSFPSLLHLSLTLSSLNDQSLMRLLPLSSRLLSLSVSRSFKMSNDSLNSPISPSLRSATTSWSNITPELFNKFLSEFKQLASLHLHQIPFVTNQSFEQLLISVPSLHSLHLSLIPLSATALQHLFSHPMLTYLDVTVDENAWASVDTMPQHHIAVWQQMSATYKEWDHRFKLGYCGIDEEEEFDVKDRLRYQQKQERKRKFYLKQKMIEEGEWEGDIDNDEYEYDDDEKEEEVDHIVKDNVSRSRYYNDVIISWSHLRYLHRLDAGDHFFQVRARHQWKRNKQLEQEERDRRTRGIQNEARIPSQQQQQEQQQEQQPHAHIQQPQEEEQRHHNNNDRLNNNNSAADPLSLPLVNRTPSGSESSTDKRRIDSLHGSPVQEAIEGIHSLVVESLGSRGKEDWNTVAL